MKSPEQPKAVLSETERRLILEYCKGYSDKEVADKLCKSYWTVKTQKKTIYRELGISKDTELLWWMVCERLKINFDLGEIRRHGIEILFSILFIVMQVTNHGGDLRRCRMARRARTELRSGSGKLHDYG
ncbi:LuxR C-terminal-related transcriptional regulator [Segatella oulorum]|uniref:helix-turn-helix transcriptional regulator n=1 Tax=Segatella oulorum TaxID=28136 RepID=UPI0028E6D3CC|nr:LuxR C-terminal-related transcriptional regulator [Segatella oulorum]